MEGAFHRVNVLHRKDELQPTYFSSLAYKDVRIDEAVIEIPNRRMIKRNVEDGVRRQRLAQLRHVDAMRAISQDELVRVDEKRRLDGRILFQAFQDRVDGPDIKIKQRIFDNRFNNMNEILDAVLVDPLGGGRKLVQLTLHGFDVRLSRAVQIGKNPYKKTVMRIGGTRILCSSRIRPSTSRGERHAFGLSCHSRRAGGDESSA